MPPSHGWMGQETKKKLLKRKPLYTGGGKAMPYDNVVRLIHEAYEVSLPLPPSLPRGSQREYWQFVLYHSTRILLETTISSYSIMRRAPRAHAFPLPRSLPPPLPPSLSISALRAPARRCRAGARQRAPAASGRGARGEEGGRERTEGKRGKEREVTETREGGQRREIAGGDNDVTRES